MIMTGTAGKRVLTSCNSSRPDWPGMRMSDISTCGGSAPCSSCEMASLAEAKLLKGMPSRDRVFSRTQRMERSSSTIQTGFIFCWLILSLEWPEQKQNSGLFDRQAQREDGVAGVARTIDGAVMVLDEILGDGQPQSTTALAPGNQRIEHPLADFIGNARAVVDDLDFHGQAITLLGQRHLAQRPGPENDLPLAVHCLRRVPGNVQHRLDQLLTVANQLRQAGVVVATNLQGTGKL